MNINQDLHSSHRIVDLLNQSLQSSEVILDQIPGMLIILNHELRVLRCNQHCLEFLGAHNEEVISKPFEEIFKNDQESQLLSERLYSESSHQNFELNLSGQSEHRIYNVNFKRVQTHVDLQPFYIFIGEDVTELRGYENKLLKIFHSTPLGIFSINPQGEVSDAYSRQLQEILEIESPQGLRFEDLFPIGHLDGVSQDTYTNFKLIHTCFELEANEVKNFLAKLPLKINYKENSGDSKWLRLQSKPIFEADQLIEILFIVEDQTSLMQAQTQATKSQALYEMALKDPLTGAFTRLHMEASFTTALASHNRGIFEHLSLAIFDLDFFKQVNDTYGHQTGDKVLQVFGQILLAEARKNDIVVRYGGEEFVVLLQSPSWLAFNFAERVRKRIQKEVFTHENDTFSVTASCGISLHEADETLEDLIENADKQLYLCKENGRNCIRVSPEAPPTT